MVQGKHSEPYSTIGRGTKQRKYRKLPAERGCEERRRGCEGGGCEERRRGCGEGMPRRMRRGAARGGWEGGFSFRK